MKKIVVVPLDSLEDDLNCGRTFDYLESYYNPGDFFDEIYCLHPLGITKKVGKVQYIRVQIKDLKNVIETIRPNIVRVYAGFGPCDWVIGSKVKNIPLVVSVHDTNPNLINQSLKFSDYIICMSQEVKKAVQQIINIEDNKLYVMPNRVDVTKFCYKKEINNLEKLNERYGAGKHILHIGRKTKQKNLDTLIRAMQYLPLEYSAIFIGPGETKTYEELAEKYNVKNRCFFIDCIPNDELPIYYSWCDCMCTPSRWEGFGIVFIEAAACECPIITSNIAPMNEYLTNGVDSVLVDDFENPKVIAENIVRICEKDDDIMNIRFNARKTGLRFSKYNIDREEKELYKEIIAKGTDNSGYYALKGEMEKLNRKIILFGAGENSKKFIKKFGIEKIFCIIDNDKRKIGGEVNGIKITGYSELLKIYKKYTVVITPGDRKEIVSQLNKDGIEYMEHEWYNTLMILKDNM